MPEPKNTTNDQEGEAYQQFLSGILGSEGHPT